MLTIFNFQWNVYTLHLLDLASARVAYYPSEAFIHVHLTFYEPMLARYSDYHYNYTSTDSLSGISRKVLVYPRILGYTKYNFDTLWQSWTTLKE